MDTNHSDYNSFAYYYDLKYQSFTYDLEFYEEMARQSGANARILELACGSGRVTLPLLEAGFNVTGLDLSEKMLEIAREKADQLPPEQRQKARFIQGDMRNFDFGGEQFDLIFIPLNSFQHLLEQDEQLQCLQAIRRHLAPAGRFILTSYNPEEKDNYPADGRVEYDREFTNPATGIVVQCFLTTTAEPSRQVRHHIFYFDEIGSDGTVRRVVARMSLRYSYRFELQLLLEKAGFRVEDFYGSYDFEEFAPDNFSFLIYVCRRG